MYKKECPVGGCDFESKSIWSGEPIGGVKRHVRELDGDGHGLRGKIPDNLMERIEEEAVEI